MSLQRSMSVTNQRNLGGHGGEFCLDQKKTTRLVKFLSCGVFVSDCPT